MSCRKDGYVGDLAAKKDDGSGRPSQALGYMNHLNSWSSGRKLKERGHGSLII